MKDEHLLVQLERNYCSGCEWEDEHGTDTAYRPQHECGKPTRPAPEGSVVEATRPRQEES
ncbi:MAG: hypothetical protein GY769_07890 [bacterium]|nr:hypothetical protein [bacterium]